MKTLSLILALALTGCATDPATVKLMLDAQQAQSARPTFALDCPAGGCKFEYTDPRDRAQLKLPTNGWDALTSVGNNAANLVPIIVTGRIATAGFDALKGSGGTVTNNTTTSTRTTGAVTTTGATTTTGAVSSVGATTTSSVGATTSMSGTGVLGSGAYSTQANPETTTTSTANPVTTSTTSTANPVTTTSPIVP